MPQGINNKTAALEDKFGGLRGRLDLNNNGINSGIVDALKGDKDPDRIYEIEKPVHRTMAEMAAAGFQIKEIASATGYSEKGVQIALRQPHARERIIARARESAQADIKRILEEEAIPSIKVLVSLRDNVPGEVPAAVRKSAADALLDRFLGKPNQPITVAEKPAESMTDEELRNQVMEELQSSQPN